MECRNCESKDNCERQCMKLPEGKTCNDCSHVERCISMFGAKRENTSCGFEPIRFVAKQKEFEETRTMNRDYVIVCNEHKGIFEGALLFWGHKTEDEEKRSFGGYTSNIDECEVYTLEEINQSKFNFPICDNSMSIQEFESLPDVAIKKQDLFNMKCYKHMHAVFRS